MKCRCPACGRSTEIEPAMLDFFTRCNRCGVLLRPRVQENDEEQTEKRALDVRVVPVGRVREGIVMNGQIADLLSRPSMVRTAATTAATLEIPLAEPFNPVAPPVAKALRPMQTPVTRQRRLFGVAGVCCLAVVATLAVVILAMKSNFSSPRTASAQTNVVHITSDQTRFTPGDKSEGDTTTDGTQTDPSRNAQTDTAPTADAH